MIPIVVDALGTVLKSIERKLEELEIIGCTKPSRPQHCIDQLKYLKESWRLEKTCCYSDSSERSPDKAGVKKTREE